MKKASTSEAASKRIMSMKETPSLADNDSPDITTSDVGPSTHYRNRSKNQMRFNYLNNRWNFSDNSVQYQGQ